MIDVVETQIERTARRKTIGLEIHPGPVVRVLAPASITDDQLRSALESKITWIHENLSDSRVKEQSKSKEMVSGESFLFKGRNYRLKVLRGVTAPTLIKDSYIIVSVPSSVEEADKEEYIKVSLEKWYFEQAHEALPAIAQWLSAQVGVKPKSVKIKSYKRSWGRCSPEGEISFNWRVVMLPPSLVNYVVAHELTHILHANHSKAFWQALGMVVTDPREKDRMLVSYIPEVEF